MKASFIKSVLSLFLFFGTLNASSQSLLTYDYDYLKNELSTSYNALGMDSNFTASLEDDLDFDYTPFETPPSLSDNQEAQQIAVLYTKFLLAFGAGLGFIDHQTLWCLNAAFYIRLLTYANNALYGGLRLTFDNVNTDNYTTRMLVAQLQLFMLTPIVYSLQTQFLYGLMGAYGFGKEKYNDGYYYNLTMLSLAAIVGFNIRMTQKWALMVYTSILSYQAFTYKPESGNSYDVLTRFALLNKRNLIALMLVYNF